MRLNLRCTDVRVAPSDTSGFLVEMDVADAEQAREQMLTGPDDAADDWPLAKRYGEVCERARMLERGLDEQDAAVRGLAEENQRLERELAEARAELSEWNDPDSSRRQALMEEIILDVGDGQRSEVELREAQLDATEAALKQARAELAEARADYQDLSNHMGKERWLIEQLARARAELEAVRKERDKLQSDWAHYVEPLKAELERSRAETAAWRNGEKGEVALFIEKERRMHARLSRLEAVVRDLEWGVRSGASQYCPTCGEERSRGHMEYCALAAALGENGEVG